MLTLSGAISPDTIASDHGVSQGGIGVGVCGNRRLPVKSLLQFRVVSKQWKFSIDNFEFIHENLAFRHMDSNLNIFSLTPFASSEGSILHEDLTYAMLHEMVMKKFNLEAIYPLNLSAKVSSIDDNFDITDDHEIRGSPYESFEMLPYYCYNLERINEGTVTRIKTDEKGVFEMLFIALGASIRTFVNYLRPLVIIDAAHLKGQYKGTNLMAVGMDGNNQIVPIAFGICKGETGPCWSWWMSVLKECIGDNPSLLFISDRHAAIALAVQNEFPLAYHAAYTTEEFSSSMSHLQDIQPDAYDKLCQLGPQRWSRAHCPLVRYNYLTSNSVESVNACTVVYRKLPVLKLAETYRAMVQDWYYKRRKLADPAFRFSSSDRSKHGADSKRWVIGGSICRSNVLMKLQEALDEEAILEEQILTLMHRFADRFTDRRVEINNLLVLQDHPLIDYAKYALGCMTGADMKKCVHLKSVRDELLRSMEEKRQLMTNYRDM
ncbi:transposase, MuDR, MULE transposase domain protein [Tanacetum coccineum]|uniref:Transposase, MuDR, MULE transposase domain protein n=1 Tax=Tanacetum coccineum TaxID=301880 RepID=A0ABQ4XAL0_9ASTR